MKLDSLIKTKPMQELKRKLNLIDHFSIEIEIQKKDFVKKFDAIVDDGETGLFSVVFEIFSNSKNTFKGKVMYDGFEIKRKRKIFDTNHNIAVATGSFKQNGGKLLIEIEIDGLRRIMVFYYLTFFSIYVVLLVTFLLDGLIGGDVEFLVSPSIFIHAVIMFVFPYFFMRKSISRLKYELEREFFYLAK